MKTYGNVSGCNDPNGLLNVDNSDNIRRSYVRVYHWPTVLLLILVWYNAAVAFIVIDALRVHDSSRTQLYAYFDIIVCIIVCERIFMKCANWSQFFSNRASTFSLVKFIKFSKNSRGNTLVPLLWKTSWKILQNYPSPFCLLCVHSILSMSFYSPISAKSSIVLHYTTSRDRKVKRESIHTRYV